MCHCILRRAFLSVLGELPTGAAQYSDSVRQNRPKIGHHIRTSIAKW